MLIEYVNNPAFKDKVDNNKTDIVFFVFNYNIGLIML